MKRNKNRSILKYVPITFTIPNGSLPDDPNKILPEFFNRIGDILMSLAYPAAVLGLMYTAYILIISIGNAEATKVAKKNISYIATGIIIIYFSKYIIKIIKDIIF